MHRRQTSLFEVSCPHTPTLLFLKLIMTLLPESPNDEKREVWERDLFFIFKNFFCTAS